MGHRAVRLHPPTGGVLGDPSDPSRALGRPDGVLPADSLQPLAQRCGDGARHALAGRRRELAGELLRLTVLYVERDGGSLATVINHSTTTPRHSPPRSPAFPVDAGGACPPSGCPWWLVTHRAARGPQAVLGVGWQPQGQADPSADDQQHQQLAGGGIEIGGGVSRTGPTDLLREPAGCVEITGRHQRAVHVAACVRRDHAICGRRPQVERKGGGMVAQHFQDLSGLHEQSSGGGVRSVLRVAILRPCR